MKNKTNGQCGSSKGFWKAYNSSRCKTAMLMITAVITVSFCIDQLFGSQNQTLTTAFFSSMFYWTGRSSKAIENKTEI